MRSAWLALVVASSAGTAVPSLARAQVGEEPSAEDKDKARQHFREAQVLFRLGKFHEAAMQFEEAYRLFPNPAFLFNLGQAWRQAGDLRKSIFFFQGYLKDRPEAPDRESIEQLVAEMQAALAAEPQDTKGEGEEPPAPAPAPAPRVERRVVDRPGLRLGGWIAIGAGGAALAGGAAFAVLARQRESELEDAYRGGETIYASTLDAQDQGDRFETLANVLGIAGLAAATTGAVLLWIGQPEEIEVTVGAAPGGALVEGRF